MDDCIFNVSSRFDGCTTLNYKNCSDCKFYKSDKDYVQIEDGYVVRKEEME